MPCSVLLLAFATSRKDLWHEKRSSGQREPEGAQASLVHCTARPGPTKKDGKMKEHPTMLLKTKGRFQSSRAVSKVFGAYPTMFMKINKLPCQSYDVDENK